MIARVLEQAEETGVIGMTAMQAETVWSSRPQLYPESYSPLIVQLGRAQDRADKTRTATLISTPS
jgi:hypothetical protein